MKLVDKYIKGEVGTVKMPTSSFTVNIFTFLYLNELL